MMVKLSATLENWFYFWAGLMFLTLAKIKHSLLGYTTPKPFGSEEIDRCVEYDVNVVSGWIKELRNYADTAVSGKSVLELGPGSDLGVGLILLARGATSYTAFDVNNLVAAGDSLLYERLFSRIQKDYEADSNALRYEYTRQQQANDGRLQFLYRADFDLLAAMKGKSIDLVFSQAAFEHFDDVERTIAALSALCIENAVAVISIDLRTHSRWIRDKDPNNIYRYSMWIYRLFNFRGIPNRIRPNQYRSLFAKYGWKDIELKALTSIDNHREIVDRNHMARQFRSADADMTALTILLCARKGAQNTNYIPSEYIS